LHSLSSKLIIIIIIFVVVTTTTITVVVIVTIQSRRQATGWLLSVPAFNVKTRSCSPEVKATERNAEQNAWSFALTPPKLFHVMMLRYR
jgi:flagellar basal body-associated protein FliL